jgi:hypothetical protein
MTFGQKGMAAAKQGNAITFEESQTVASSSSSSSSGSGEIHVFTSGLLNLLSAMRHTEDANFHKVMMNIQLLVFAVSWFGMVWKPFSIFIIYYLT